MSDGPTLVTTAWGLASAFGVGVLGAISLAGGRSRPPGGLAFGLFGIGWGVSTGLANLMNLTSDPHLAVMLYLLFLAFTLPLPYLLVEFATAQLSQPRAVPLWGAARAIAFLAGMAASFTLLLAPDLLLRGVLPGTPIRPDWGPWFTPLVSGPHFLAFGLAIVALYHATQASPTERVASRMLLLLAGLGLYAGFSAANNLTFYVLGSGRLPDRWLRVGLFGALTAVAVGVAFALLRDAAARPLSAEARRRRGAALAILFPAAWGATEAALGLGRTFGFQSVGLWRIAGIALLTYGVIRWRVWDLPDQARRAVAGAAGVTAAGAGGALAYGAASLVLPWPPGGALVGLAAAGAVLVPSIQAAGRWLRPEQPGRTDPSARYSERVDAYRAALERSLSRGTLAEDERFLEALRLRVGLEPAEHRVLLHLARQSVPIQRPAGPAESFDRLRLLGEGGSARTWLARDRTRDRLVVLKEPLAGHREAALRDRMLREARLAAKVRHANVVRTEAVLDTPQGPVLVMEYLEGGSLADHLAERGHLPCPEAVSLVLAIAAGVDAVHRAGIVHRDLKPANILLDGAGLPKVADFGIALAPRRDTFHDPAAPAAGTRPYMSPEAAQGLPVDRRTDVYGCAAILHECLYGSPPGDGPVAVRHDVPPHLSAALQRGLAARPEDRFASVRAFAHALGKEG